MHREAVHEVMFRLENSKLESKNKYTETLATADRIMAKCPHLFLGSQTRQK